MDALIAEDMALLDETHDEWESMGFGDAWGDGDAGGEDAPDTQDETDGVVGGSDVSSDTVGQEWGDAAAAAEAARGEGGGDGGRAGPGWRRRVTTMARWEPSAWAHMCRALGKRSHDVMRGETEDVVGD